MRQMLCIIAVFFLILAPFASLAASGTLPLATGGEIPPDDSGGSGWNIGDRPGEDTSNELLLFSGTYLAPLMGNTVRVLPMP